MFLTHRTLGIAGLVLLGLIFGLAWNLTRNPSPGELASSREAALSYLLHAFDQDKHFLLRRNLAGVELSVSRREQFVGELSAAATIAAAARSESTISDEHRKNLEIILKDWYSGSGPIAYFSNGGVSSMEQNGQALLLLAASPFFEEERAKAERLAVPIMEWAHREFTSYWRGAASTTPAESLGYGILGLAALYGRTGDSTLREAVALLGARYRLLLDESPLKFLVRAALFETLREEEDARALTLAANVYLPLQNRNVFQREHGLFKNQTGAYYPLAEQAIIVQGLARAAALSKDTNASSAMKKAALRGAGALTRFSLQTPAELRGAVTETREGSTVSAQATALFADALAQLAE